jgi:hypothetical protein
MSKPPIHKIRFHHQDRNQGKGFEIRAIPHRPPARLGLALCLGGLLSAAPVAWGEWRNAPAQSGDGQVAASDNGALRLEIQRERGGQVVARLSLTRGYDRFAPYCPTFAFDDQPPPIQLSSPELCRVVDREAVLHLGRIDRGGIDSAPLDKLMNVGFIAFRFRTQAGDYREVRFSLKGSKKRIEAALGPGVKVTSPERH